MAKTSEAQKRASRAWEARNPEKARIATEELRGSSSAAMPTWTI